MVPGLEYGPHSHYSGIRERTVPLGGDIQRVPNYVGRMRHNVGTYFTWLDENCFYYHYRELLRGLGMDFQKPGVNDAKVSSWFDITLSPTAFDVLGIRGHLF